MGPADPVASFGPLPRSGSRGLNAAAAAGDMMLGMTAQGATGGPGGLIVGGALGIAMAPFAAVAGAAMAETRIQPETYAANQRLMTAAAETDWTGQLQDALRVALDGLGAPAKTGILATSHLGLWVEGP